MDWSLDVNPPWGTSYKVGLNKQGVRLINLCVGPRWPLFFINLGIALGCLHVFFVSSMKITCLPILHASQSAERL